MQERSTPHHTTGKQWFYWLRISSERSLCDQPLRYRTLGSSIDKSFHHVANIHLFWQCNTIFLSTHKLNLIAIWEALALSGLLMGSKPVMCVHVLDGWSLALWLRARYDWLKAKPQAFSGLSWVPRASTVQSPQCLDIWRRHKAG